MRTWIPRVVCHYHIASFVHQEWFGERREYDGVHLKIPCSQTSSLQLLALHLKNGESIDQKMTSTDVQPTI
jgi:hypothetical protein